MVFNHTEVTPSAPTPIASRRPSGDSDHIDWLSAAAPNQNVHDESIGEARPARSYHQSWWFSVSVKRAPRHTVSVPDADSENHASGIFPLKTWLMTGNG